MLDLLVGTTLVKDVLKFGITAVGEQSVMMDLMILTLRLFAVNWDMHGKQILLIYVFLP